MADSYQHHPGDEGDQGDRIQQHYEEGFNRAGEGGLYHPDEPEEEPASEGRDESNLDSVRKGEEGSKKHSLPGNGDKESGFYKNKKPGEEGGDEGGGKGILGKLRSKLKGGSEEGTGGIPRPYKYAFAGGAIGTLVMFVIIIMILFSLFGSLKVVHFATILRSAGLARFTLQMQKQYTRTLVDSASLTSDSTGSLSKALGDRSLTQKLIGVNPQKRAIQLGESNDLKFNFQSKRNWRTGGLTKTNDFKGVSIDGEEVSLDQFAQKAFGKNYNKLSFRERLTVESQFATDVKVRLGITDKLSLEGLWFRSDVYAIFRQAVGISMFKWVNKAKDYLGKSPKDALAEDIKDTTSKVDQRPAIPDTIDDTLKKDAQDLQAQADKNAAAGVSNDNLRPRSAKIASAAGKVSVAVFATTVACVVHELDNSFQEAGKETEGRAARLGHDALTTGDQIEEGDTAAEAVGAEATRWENSDQSALYRQSTGVPLSNANLTELTNIPNVEGPVSTFATVIKYVDQAFNGASPVFNLPWVGGKAKDLTCKAVLNQYVQYGIAGGELIAAVFTAGAEEGILQGVKAAIIGSIKLAGTVGIGELLGQMLDKAVHSLASLDYSATDNNSKLFDESYVGVDLLGQTGNRQASYGRPLSSAEASTSQSQAMTAIAEENKHASFTQRYFAITNPNSLIGTVAAAAPSSLGGVSSYAQRSLAFIGSLFSSPQQLFQRLGTLFMPHALAADTIYTGAIAGVDEWGWSSQESLEVYGGYDSSGKYHAPDPSFSVLDGSLQNYVEPHLDDWTNKYNPCYTYVKQQDKPTDTDCSAGTLGSPEALHWRAYMSESCIADSMKPDNSTGNCAYVSPSQGASL